MRKRISSIMDTKKKKNGFVIICAVLAVTLGTGVAFAADVSVPIPAASVSAHGNNTFVTNAVTKDSSQTLGNIKWEPLPEYEKFGISYDKDKNMLFEGKLVRYFFDGYEFERGGAVTRYDHLNENGVVDVHTVRDVIDNGDGSVDFFGNLVDIVAYSQQEFASRDIEGIRGNGAQETIAEAETGTGIIVDADSNSDDSALGTGTTITDSSTSDAGGRTFAEIFSEFEKYGIEFTAINGRGTIGNVTYHGKAVKKFIDVKNDGGVFTYQSVGGGDITVQAVYDSNGQLTEIEIVN